MRQLPLKPFYFLRHGETDWNKKGVYMGQQDIPLNETGKAQASSVKQYIKNEPIDHIAVSPLIRAHETAQIINKEFGFPTTVLDELKECNFGDAEGQEHTDILVQKWMNGEHPKGSESRIEFENRVMAGINKAVQLSQNVLIVSHGGVYTCLSRMMGWPVIHLNNCATIFHKPPEQPTHPWNFYPLAEKISR